MSWTPDSIRVFIAGCILGAFVSFMLTFSVFMHMVEKESQRMEEKYKALRLECNSLERKNYKLIRFIKERRWEDG